MEHRSNIPLADGVSALDTRGAPRMEGAGATWSGANRIAPAPLQPQDDGMEWLSNNTRAGGAPPLDTRGAPRLEGAGASWSGAKNRAVQNWFCATRELRNKHPSSVASASSSQDHFFSRCGVNLSSCFPPRLFKCLSRRFIAARLEPDTARPSRQSPIRRWPNLVAS